MSIACPLRMQSLPSFHFRLQSSSLLRGSGIENAIVREWFPFTWSLNRCFLVLCQKYWSIIVPKLHCSLNYVIKIIFSAANRVIFHKGAIIDCGSQFITVILDRAQYPWFNPRRMRMHLNDPRCRPFENNTHVSFKIPLGGCGSRHITTSRKVMFFNRVFIANKPYHMYRERTGKSIMEIHFYCKYKRTDSPSQKIKGFL